MLLPAINGAVGKAAVPHSWRTPSVARKAYRKHSALPFAHEKPLGEGHLALAPSDVAAGYNVHARSRARLSVVVPIGIIVGVAILCVIVAVLGSAQRADEVALDTERQLFTPSRSNQ